MLRLHKAIWADKFVFLDKILIFYFNFPYKRVGLGLQAWGPSDASEAYWWLSAAGSAASLSLLSWWIWMLMVSIAFLRAFCLE